MLTLCTCACECACVRACVQQFGCSLVLVEFWSSFSFIVRMRMETLKLLNSALAEKASHRYTIYN